jgi:hypothetical protein
VEREGTVVKGPSKRRWTVEGGDRGKGGRPCKGGPWKGGPWKREEDRGKGDRRKGGETVLLFFVEFTIVYIFCIYIRQFHKVNVHLYARRTLAYAAMTGRVRALTKSSSWAVVQHSNAVQ